MHKVPMRWAVSVLLLGFLAPAAVSADTGKPHRRLSAAGKVVDRDGRPVAGATVYLRGQPEYYFNVHPGLPVPPDIFAKTATDAQGRFAFRSVPVPSTLTDFELEDEMYYPWQVVVTAPGFGIAWQQLWLKYQQNPFTLRLLPEATVQGSLAGPDGKPVAGVKVRVLEIAALHKYGTPTLGSDGYLRLARSQVSFQATTDATGRFTLGGLPPRIRVSLEVLDHRYIRQLIYVATMERPPPQLPDLRYEKDGTPIHFIHDEPVHGNRFTARLRPGPRLAGRVVFADTGRPAIGAGLRLEPEERDSERWWLQVVDTVADADGRFVLARFPPGKYYLFVDPPAGADYLGFGKKLEVSPDLRATDQSIRLVPGGVVLGQVVDKENGKGIAGVEIYYQELAPGPRTFPANYVHQDVRTGPDGRFRALAAPGKGKITVGSAPGYNMDRQVQKMGGSRHNSHTVEVRAGQTVGGIHFALDRGGVITGRVLDPEGKPVQGAQLVEARSLRRPRNWATTDAKGHFTLSGLDSKPTQDLVVLHLERRLIRRIAVPVPADKPAEVRIRLQRMGGATGRVMDDAGKPVAEAWVQGVRNTHAAGALSYFSLDRIAVLTDAEGRFNLDALLPGVEYRVEATAGSHSGDQSGPFRVDPGRTHPLPDITIFRADQAIAGAVLDPGGRSLAGVRVWGHSQPPNGGRGIEVFTWTDANGRFRLQGLPRGKVRLSATLFRKVDQRTARYFQSETRAEGGARDVRIVLSVPDEKRAAEAVAGQPAPEFAAHAWLNRPDAPAGQGFRRDDFRGKVVVLAFVDEARSSQRLLPALDRLHQNHAKHGLIILRVYESEKQTKKQELAKLSPTPACLVAPGLVPGGHGEAFRTYGVQGTPTLFVIDRRGVLRHLDVEPEALPARVQELLKR